MANTVSMMAKSNLTEDTKPLTKNDINQLVNKELERHLKSKAFKDRVQTITSSAVEELFKTLWQRTSIWKSSMTR